MIRSSPDVSPSYKRRLAERRDDVLHQQDQMERIGWGWCEFRDQVKVEVSGLVRLRVNDEASTADFMGKLDRT